MGSRCVVTITRSAEKELRRIPAYIRAAVYLWVESVERLGFAKVRQISGYHDEPLKGERQGQRSVRLNRAYRLFYEEDKRDQTILVTVIEVNKHEY
jgi:proteic killer suppression protein